MKTEKHFFNSILLLTLLFGLFVTPAKAGIALPGDVSPVNLTSSIFFGLGIGGSILFVFHRVRLNLFVGEVKKGRSPKSSFQRYWGKNSKIAAYLFSIIGGLGSAYLLFLISGG